MSELRQAMQAADERSAFDEMVKGRATELAQEPEAVLTNLQTGTDKMLIDARAKKRRIQAEFETRISKTKAAADEAINVMEERINLLQKEIGTLQEAILSRRTELNMDITMETERFNTQKAAQDRIIAGFVAMRSTILDLEVHDADSPSPEA